MPSILPLHMGKLHRHRAVIPIKKVHEDDIWQRILDLHGFELLNAPKSSSSRTTHKAPAIMADSTQTLTEGAKAPLNVLDLSVELQKLIFQHASTTDLIALSLVSKHFRDLAAEQIYRSFHIVFPDEDHSTVDSIDVLAAGLETLTSSDYNYAQYLREIVLEPVAAGDKGESAYQYYMYDQSCGKFMNALFLLVLRKARCLETFRWDIRVELSRPVFKALHEIEALQHVHLRMQSGHSTYIAPPIFDSSGTIHIINHPVSLPPPPPPPGFGPPPHGHSASHYASSTFNSFGGSGSKSSKSNKNAKALLPAIKKPAPTISGFKGLKTLEVLDMDTLDYISELRGCIRNSSSTIKTLKLSFSESLANKSRKPPPEVHSDDESEVEDEFGQVIPLGPPPGMPSSSTDGPTKVIKAAEEKKKQEEVLQKIFGITPGKKLKSGKVETIVEEKDEEKENDKAARIKTSDDPKAKFIANLGPVAKKLMKFVSPGSDNIADGKKILEMIENAARLYTESAEAAKVVNSAGEGSCLKNSPATSATSVDGDSEAVMSGGGTTEPGLFDGSAKPKKVQSEPGVSNPDDFDIEEPEGNELDIEVDDPTTETEKEEISSEPLAKVPDVPAMVPDEVPEEAPEEAPEEVPEEKLAVFVSEGKKDANDAYIQQVENTQQTHSAQSEEQLSVTLNGNKRQLMLPPAMFRTSSIQIQEEFDTLHRKMDALTLEMLNRTPGDTREETFAAILAEYDAVSNQVSDLRRKLTRMATRTADVDVNVDVDADAPVPVIDKPRPSESSSMSDYVRSTRGLSLDSLAIYLIPVRATILARGVDMTVLREITLLNVGPQNSLWGILAKMYTIKPLPLAKIYTDNVTLTFLGLVAQLENLTELIMVERQKPGRPESTAGKTVVKIDQIRKALKRRIGNLKVLMIKHDSSSDWDLDVKTTMMLCFRAGKLEELSATFTPKVVHPFTQFMQNMVALRVLHINFFRNEDQCPWSKQHFLKFVVDIVSVSNMKLDYIALDQVIERLVRVTKGKASKKVDKKGKGKATDARKLVNMVLGPAGSWSSTGAINDPGYSSKTPYFDWQDSSDDEGEPMPMVGKHGLNVETMDGVHFTDVAGVRIFEKDVTSGRL